MKRTLNEKYNYNSTQDNDFSRGYCLGVRYYSNYGKSKAIKFDKQAHNDFIDGMKSSAIKGYKYAKGFMCGIRDAANERKEKQKKG